MKKLILLTLLIIGCKEPLEPEDCAGVAGGNAVVDDCGVCNGIADYVAGSCYDCADTPNGDAVDFGCGICIDYNSISFSKVNDNTSASLLPTVCDYKNNFSDTYTTPAPNMESSYIFFDSENDTNSIIISAPHSQRAY